METIQELAGQRVGKISDSLISGKHPFEKGIGLYSGDAGLLLFLHLYLHYNPNPSYSHKLDEITDNFLEGLTSRFQYHTYCSGITGVFKSLEVLDDMSILHMDYKELVDAYRPFLLQQMNRDILSGNYDFLHGGLGTAVYFKDDPEFAENAVTALEEMSIPDGDKIKWESSLGEDQDRGFNICLSHGMSSIGIYLGYLISKNLEAERAARLLEGTVNYILSQRVDRDKHGCCFPSQSLENGDGFAMSRMAWCYGDLGVGAALWQAGKFTGNKEWMSLAEDVYDFSCGRLTVEQACAFDAGICHGTAGVAMMFKYMFNQTGHKRYLDTYNHWIKETLKRGGFEDGIGGYKRYMPPEKRWENSTSLLDGSSGIGLILMDCALGERLLSDKIHEIFLLF